jgi:hypothetical protein
MVKGVLTHLSASVGPLTGVFEALATSIGAGVVIGSFVVGLTNLVLGRGRGTSEEEALYGGYVGGAVGLGLLAIDIVEKHFV